LWFQMVRKGIFGVNRRSQGNLGTVLGIHAGIGFV